jgi:antitoxin HicB
MMHETWLGDGVEAQEMDRKVLGMRQLSYRTMLRKEPEGGYTVTVPSLPGCVTYGENIDHAILMAKEAIALYVESLEAHGEEVPSDAETLEYTLTMPAYA